MDLTEAKKWLIIFCVAIVICVTYSIISKSHDQSVIVSDSNIQQQGITQEETVQQNATTVTEDKQQQADDESDDQIEQLQPEIEPISNIELEEDNVDIVATYYVANCKKSITLRAEPTITSSEITQIPLGQAVGFIENADNGFCKINYDGIVGYALATYLSDVKQKSNVRMYAQVVNCDKWITLRSKPSTTASSLAHIPLGEYVIYIDDVGNGFYCIEYHGIRGYSLQRYLVVR